MPKPRHKTQPHEGDNKQFLRLYELFGLSFQVNGSAQVQADECPFCGKGRFYLNAESGLYKCHSGSCGRSGNAYDFINQVYGASLDATTDDDRRELKQARGIPLQTIKRHGLAFNKDTRGWLIPYKSPEGRVQNLLRYGNGGVFCLPSLPLRLFGLDKLSDKISRTLFLCEGPWDAIALDMHLRSNKTRVRYDILAVPGATIFKPEWFNYIKDRPVRVCFDNDKAGRDGQQRVLKLAREQKVNCKLSVLDWPGGSPAKCDIRDLVEDGVNVAEFTREHCVRTTAERRIKFVRADQIPDEDVEWFWEDHIPFSTFISLSGTRGSQKSLIARYLAARATAGLPMPNCKDACDPMNVLYFTSEDAASRVKDLVDIHGGDLKRLHVFDIAADSLDGDPIDLLECLEEWESHIKILRARLVIIDALNSFVGGDISTDSKARRSLSGRLQALARRSKAGIFGIRNWGRSDSGSSEDRALGAISLSDVARCTMNTRILEEVWPYQLEFERVSDAPKPKPIRYKIEDLSTGKRDRYRRKIIWEKPTNKSVKQVMDDARKKRSAKR